MADILWGSGGLSIWEGSWHHCTPVSLGAEL